MESKLFGIIVLMVAGLVFAQSGSVPSEPTVAKPAPREHRGFYNSVSFGAAYNWYKSSRENDDTYTENGVEITERNVDYFEFDGFTFPMFEFKFGVAMANLVALHTVFNFGFFAGSEDWFYREYEKACLDNRCTETEKTKEREEESSDGFGFRTFVGLGSTVYPFRDKTSALNGFFVGGALGYTMFLTYIDGDAHAAGDGGPAFQVEMGKEWWINDHLSIGVGLEFAHTSLSVMSVESYKSDNVISLSLRLTRG